QNLKAIEVDGVVVAPPWDVPQGTSKPVIVIEPSMGFGTGHHATTRLCLRLLQRRELRGARVIDIGTGSGVLALAAWKLGARDVVAIDNDPDALDSARANIARNGGAAAIDVTCDDSDGDDCDGVRAQRTATERDRHPARPHRDFNLFLAPAPLGSDNQGRGRRPASLDRGDGMAFDAYCRLNEHEPHLGGILDDPFFE